MQFVEPPFSITLTFADGTTTAQACNARLWNLYRGTSVGPYVLQSALMALEKWLFAYAEGWPNELDALLVSILRRSSNAAMTAVVASVATAFPRVAAEAILVLLSSRESILLDRARLSVESQTGMLSGMLPFRDAEQRIYDAERKEANALPHRKHDLETAVANVQLGQHCARVEQLIDRHRQEMPPISEQTEEDRIWRLALHRMDLRQYTVASSPQGSTESPADAAGAEAGRQMIRLELREADPDVQQMADAAVSEYGAMNRRISLLMWGMKVFSREDEANYDPAHWRTRLQEALELPEDSESEDGFGPGRGGPEYIASVCIRDHFDELTPHEADWCIETVCHAVESQAGNWNEMARVQHYSMSGDRPSAWVLSIFVGKDLTDEQRHRVRAAICIAVLHPIDEVRVYATWGIGQNLWSSDRLLAIRCINVLATEAKTVHERWRAEMKRPFDRRVPHSQIEYEVGTAIRDEFYGDIDQDAYKALDVSNWIGSKANCGILRILCRAPNEPLAIDAFRRLAEVLVSWWDADDDQQSNRRRERSIDIEIALTSLFEQFVLNVTRQQGEVILEPVLNAMNRHPDKVAGILQGIIGFEDRTHSTAQFWHIWELFAAGTRRASWLGHIDGEHPNGGPVMAAVFLTNYWKDEVRHWRSLEGHAFRVHRLFESLPTSATVLDDYVRFLYHVGEQSLPAAFEHIGNRLKAGKPQDMLRKGNTVFMLETLLRRYVYGRPMELKRNRELREAVLYLLDVLVESGSSAAYRMRDDFVTPVA